VYFFVLFGIWRPPPPPPAQLIPETFIKRQAMRHDCLSSLLGDGDKQSEEKNIVYWTDQSRTKSRVPAQDQQRINQGRTRFICTTFVETEANGGVLLPWLFHWAPCAGTKDFSSTFAALVCTVPNIFTSFFPAPVINGGVCKLMFL
jgi:hypothetical protein